jgi:hypothetical protein
MTNTFVMIAKIASRRLSASMLLSGVTAVIVSKAQYGERIKRTLAQKEPISWASAAVPVA